MFKFPCRIYDMILAILLDLPVWVLQMVALKTCEFTITLAVSLAPVGRDLIYTLLRCKEGDNNRPSSSSSLKIFGTKLSGKKNISGNYQPLVPNIYMLKWKMRVRYLWSSFSPFLAGGFSPPNYSKHIESNGIIFPKCLVKMYTPQKTKENESRVCEVHLSPISTSRKTNGG